MAQDTRVAHGTRGSQHFKELLRWKCTTCWIWNELSLSLEYGARFGTRGYRRSRLDKLWLLFSLFAESDRKRCPRNFSRWRRKHALLWLAIFYASRLLNFLYEIISSTWSHEHKTIAAKFLPFQKFTMIRIFLKGFCNARKFTMSSKWNLAQNFDNRKCWKQSVVFKKLFAILMNVRVNGDNHSEKSK